MTLALSGEDSVVGLAISLALHYLIRLSPCRAHLTASHCESIPTLFGFTPMFQARVRLTKNNYYGSK